MGYRVWGVGYRWGMGYGVFLAVFVFLVNVAHALDPMYDYRYTLGPEIVVPNALHIGVGAFTRYNEDLTLVSNLQVGITDEFEAGIKFLVGTNDYWVIERVSYHNPRDILPIINVGVKYAILPHLAMQADIPIALNKDRDWGGILSISKWDGYTKNVSFLYEGRVGIGGPAGDGNHAKLSLAWFPYIQIGQYFRISVGTVGSGSYESFKDDVMLDILPRVELGLALFRLTGEVSIDILTWDAKKYNRFALFAVADI